MSKVSPCSNLNVYYQFYSGDKETKPAQELEFRVIRTFILSSLICSPGFNRDLSSKDFFILETFNNPDRTHLSSCSLLFHYVVQGQKTWQSVSTCHCVHTTRKISLQLIQKVNFYPSSPTSHKTEHHKSCAVGVPRTLSSVRNLFCVFLVPSK